MDVTIRDDLTQESLDRFFLNDPTLCSRSLDDKALAVLYYDRKLPISSSSKYVGVYGDGELVAVVKMEPFTDVALCVHSYLASRLHGKGVSLNLHREVVKYIKSYLPRCVKILVPVPSVCSQVKKAATALGMKLEATISSTVSWRQEVVDLLIYGLDLNKEE